MEDLTRLRELDGRIVRAAKGIKVLSGVAWPVDVMRRFLEAWDAGRPELPRPEYPAQDHAAAAAELEDVMAACDRGHPLGAFLYRTARSYRRAASLLESRGTAAFLEHSRALYGDTRMVVAGDETTTVTAARRLIDLTRDYVDACALHEEDFCVVPAAVAETMREHAASFADDPVEIVVDPSLSAKAAAGAIRVRIRGETCFSASDVPQLVHHELFVHTLTALNGRRQPTLTSLGLGAPRTTRTQEGLALFAEMITNSFDVNRLRRIAARAVAIDMALDGADFLDVFRYFLECGQTEREAASSAERVYRGGDPRGGIPFTKDAVYFQGLVRVHTFLRDAIHDGRVADPAHLMCGRLTVGDVRALDPYFENGVLAPPRYLPDWVRARARLVAFLLYASFVNELHLESLVGRPHAAE